MHSAHETSALTARAQRIRVILLDVDGVLTDGRLHFSGTGEPGVSFDIQDGLALKLAQRAGLQVGLLSGRSSEAVARRARDLALDHVILGRVDKGTALDEWQSRTGYRDEEIAYAGDDLPDLAVLARCGLGFAPANAAVEVRETAQVVLDHQGGDGAVREMIELILRWRDEWQQIVDHFRA